MASLSLRDIRKSFGPVEVLHGINLEVEQGEFIVFVGPSGCGKSTLLRLIAGLEEVSAGEIEIGGVVSNEIPPAHRGIAMVFQSYALYPHMTVFDNMAFGLRLAHTPKAEVREKVNKAAKMLKLEEYLRRLPRQLSGGQRQRVAIGRAVTRDPKVFLFDEPLSNLDAALRVATRVEIASLKRKLPNTTMVYVTHDQVEAMTLADRIVVLSDGNIEQVGAPLELYHKPRNLFVAQFIGSPAMNISDATGTSSGTKLQVTLTDASKFELDGTGLAGQGGRIAKFGIRPEHLRIAAKADARISGHVLAAEELGELTIVHFDPGDGNPIIAKIASTVSAEVGSEIFLTFDDDSAHLFDEKGVAIRP